MAEERQKHGPILGLEEKHHHKGLKRNRPELAVIPAGLHPGLPRDLLDRLRTVVIVVVEAEVKAAKAVVPPFQNRRLDLVLHRIGDWEEGDLTEITQL